MNKLVLIILFFSITFAGDNDVKMKSKPKKENGVSLSNEVVLNTEDGFYKRTISSVSPNGKFVVLDVGNAVMMVFDSKGNLVKEFGKAGQGPGEFNINPMGGGIAKIFTTEKYIITQEYMKLMFFDYDGNLVREVKTLSGFGFVEVKNDVIVHTYPKHKFFEHLQTKTDFQGKKVGSIPNDSYNSTEASQKFLPQKFMERITMPYVFAPYQNGYIQIYFGEYKFQHFSNNRKDITTYTRAYERYKEYEDPFAEWKKRAKGNKQFAAVISNMAQQYNSFSKGYQSDILSIAGSYKDYLFIQTSVKDANTINFDVISPPGELYTTLSIKGDPTFDFQQGSQPKVENGKLIINYINEEDGPYVKVYDISIN